MSKISFVTSTGNHQADKIFKGVFGELDAAGVFTVDEALKKIHLFNLVTPEGLKAQGIDLSESMVTLDIDDQVLPALKATSIHAMKVRWLAAYDTERMPQGLAAAALNAERANVDAATSSMLAEIGLPMTHVKLSREFQDVIPDGNYGDGNHCAELKGPRIVECLNEGAWQLTDQSVDMATLSFQETTNNSRINFASGSLVTETLLFGNPEQLPALIDAINQLPKVLQKDLNLAAQARIASIQWQETPTPVNQIQAQPGDDAQGEAAGSANDASDAPAA